MLDVDLASISIAVLLPGTVKDAEDKRRPGNSFVRIALMMRLVKKSSSTK